MQKPIKHQFIDTDVGRYDIFFNKENPNVWQIYGCFWLTCEYDVDMTGYAKKLRNMLKERLGRDKRHIAIVDSPINKEKHWSVEVCFVCKEEGFNIDVKREIFFQVMREWFNEMEKFDVFRYEKISKLRKS